MLASGGSSRGGDGAPRTLRQTPERFGDLGTCRTVSAGQEICVEGEPAEQWYRVDAGAARQIAIAKDGRRQIVDLLLLGDYFGFTSQTHYDFTVEAAADDTAIRCFSRRAMERLVEADHDLARDLLHVTLKSLARLQAIRLVLGRVTATEKVASFLLHLSSRLDQEDPERLVLPVMRMDIADNLALSVETVSRALTSLKQHNAIRSSGSPSIIVLDRRALENLLDNPRHHPAKAGGPVPRGQDGATERKTSTMPQIPL